MRSYYVHPVIAGETRSRGKRWVILVFLLIIMLVMGGYVYFALSRPLQVGMVNLAHDAPQTTDSIEISWPEQGQAAIGTLDNGVLASSHDDEQPRPIASLTKVITALAVLEKAPMQPGETGISLVFDAEDEQSYRDYLAKLGTVTNVAAGEQFNQYQALQAMLLPSSNNMSDSLVRRVFGSMEEYTKYANQMLERYGLTKTHVADASGFSPQSVSTPSEMIIIGQKALQNPVIAEIVAQPQAELPLSGVVPNYNGLLRVEGVNGIKPGNTDEAGWCLLFSATHRTATNQEITFIGVLLGEDNPYELLAASENILNIAKSNVSQVEVVRGGDAIGSYVTAWGDEVRLVAQESLWTYTLGGRAPRSKFTNTEFNPLLSANNPIGVVALEQDATKSVQVVAASDTPAPPLLWRLKNPLIRWGIIN